MSKILLHIGFPKACSSFLGNWFHQNPNFIFRDFSIAGFENTIELINQSVYFEALDEKIFVVRDMRFSAPNKNAFRNTDSLETAQKKIAQTLHSLFPHAKILIVTRGFRSAIRANYSQYLKEGGYLRFATCVENNKNSNWLPYNYNFLIELYSNLFGKDNILVLPFELIKSNSAAFLEPIEKFLEIPHFEFQPEIENPSLSDQQMTAIRKINRCIFICLYIFGPFQPFFYKQYAKILDKFKTKSWNNGFINVISKAFKTDDFNFIITKEIHEKFHRFGIELKNCPHYKNLTKEYFIDTEFESLNK